MPNIESANVAMRKALDLFANVRPVKVPEKGIDWTFFRENTEGAYAVGSKGINVDDDLAFDFVVATSEGSERIAKMASMLVRITKIAYQLSTKLMLLKRQTVNSSTYAKISARSTLKSLLMNGIST